MVTRSRRQRVRSGLLFSRSVCHCPSFLLARPRCHMSARALLTLVPHSKRHMAATHTHTCRYMTKYSCYCYPLPTSWPLTWQPLPVTTRILPYYSLALLPPPYPRWAINLNYQCVRLAFSIMANDHFRIDFSFVCWWLAFSVRLVWHDQFSLDFHHISLTTQLLCVYFPQRGNASDPVEFIFIWHSLGARFEIECNRKMLNYIVAMIIDSTFVGYMTTFPQSV